MRLQFQGATWQRCQRHLSDNVSDATLTWEDPLVDGVDTLASSVSAIAWLRAGQERLRQSIAALDEDAELLRLRLTNWASSRRRAGSSR